MTGSNVTSAQASADLAYLSATEAARRFRAGELLPSELLEAVCAQIDRVNGDRETGINALTEQLRDDAFAAAALADARFASWDGESELPSLLGIPVATKEKHAIAGHTLEQGLLAHRGNIVDHDGVLVTRVREAGGIVHARTTTPEFSCASVTESELWGTTRNPWKLSATPGGSSGGAGAALAAGMTTLATASDIGGSTRIPAGFTGTVGYKAPYGRVPGVPPLAGDWYRGDGPMARTVADTAMLAGVLGGRDASDHTSWGPRNTRPDTGEWERGAAAARGLRIGYAKTLGDFPVERSVQAATDRAVELLARAGAEIVEVTLPWTVDGIIDTLFAHFGNLLGPALQLEVSGSAAPIAPYLADFVARAQAGAERCSLPESLALDARVQAELAAAMHGLDALICPTQGAEMLTAEWSYADGIEIAGTHYPFYMTAHLTMPFNIANRCPVLSVPSGISTVGVPTGVQVVGHPWDEAMVFRVGEAIEALVPSIGRPLLA